MISQFPVDLKKENIIFKGRMIHQISMKLGMSLKNLLIKKKC